MHASSSSETLSSSGTQSTSATAWTRLEARLPIVLSIIAGMVDFTGFFTLGNIFTAHVTGNLVVAAAALVGDGPVKVAQLLAIPVFMLALSGVWLIARIVRQGPAQLLRLLLGVQFVLLAVVLVVSVSTRASAHAHEPMAGVAAMVAVAAMATQYALLRLAIPGAISTAVMTGNLTNTVLLSLDLLAAGRSRTPEESGRLRSVGLLIGFLGGCVAAAVAVSVLADWAWTLPVVLAAIAVLLT